ncbi:hypothetical protein [Brevibacillus sp. DP1.3A]|uniref:hypothetical protein n=1 Tax=Brevibacillus sp. DP1.3A TaxID=2738867 RepID=UPI00156BC470|nr:hypothetical protein [Brevibacillus sp. DP1.3A]UED78067.1 hypothetical protein HP399_030905 [Brevibacillus sp. DP1.3A]
MESIQTVVDGRMMAIPVLTAKHLSVISRVHSGACPGCDPDILRDLVEAGLVEDEPGGK